MCVFEVAEFESADKIKVVQFSEALWVQFLHEIHAIRRTSSDYTETQQITQNLRVLPRIGTDHTDSFDLEETVAEFFLRGS